MTRDISNAAAERAAAQKAIQRGLQERETYTAKQVAMRCGTDAKTMRKFFRSDASSVEAVGQGGRYEFDKADMPTIKQEFFDWLNRSSVKRPKAAPEVKTEVERFNKVIAMHPELDESSLEENEPTDEELLEIEDLDLDLEDLEA